MRTRCLALDGWFTDRSSSSPHSPKISQTTRIRWKLFSVHADSFPKFLWYHTNSCSVLWFCFGCLGYAWSRPLIALHGCFHGQRTLWWRLSVNSSASPCSHCWCHVSRCYHLPFHFHNQFTSPVQPGPASRPVTAGEGPAPDPKSEKQKTKCVPTLLLIDELQLQRATSTRRDNLI